MTVLLAIETSTNACSAALLQQNDCIERFEIAPRAHTDLILNMIESLLEAAELQRKDITQIAYGAGPGSFMGSRLATGVAQGIAFGLQCRVVPVSTLQALAQTCYEATGHTKIVVGWDARMQEIYCGAYQLGAAGIMEPVIQDQLCAPDQFKFELKDGWVQMGLDIYPRASAVAKIASVTDISIDPSEATPIYLRNAVV